MDILKPDLLANTTPALHAASLPPPSTKRPPAPSSTSLYFPTFFSRVHVRERYRLADRNWDQALFGFHGFWYVLYAKHTVFTVLLYLFYSTSNNIFIYLCARIFWIYYLVFLLNYWVIRLKYLLSELFLINDKFHSNVTTQIL